MEDYNLADPGIWHTKTQETGVHMKHLVMASVMLAICSLGLARTKDTTKELVAAEESFNGALLRGDWKSIEQLYDNDLIFTNADGSVSHKSDDVATIKMGEAKFESIEMSNVNVQDLGEVAVVTGKLLEKGHYKTEDLGGTYRFTDVWAKRNGRWQLVAGQETRYAPPK